MEFGFGLGRLHHVLRQPERERVVRAVVEAGFTHLDLAPAYGDGLLEAEVGRALTAIGGREKLRIATKFGIPFRPIGELPGPAYFALRALGKALKTSFGARYGERDFGPKELVSSVHNSLRRIRTDYIDLLVIHEPRDQAEFRSLEGTWGELEKLRRQGKIRQFGVSGESDPLLDADDAGLIPAVAVRMTPLSPRLIAKPPSWFAEREVIVFNVVKHLRSIFPTGRIETKELVRTAHRLVPAARLLLASNNVDEIRRMGEVTATLARESMSGVVS
jgi:aryl-alcohol dehydrogenase-like predicted oxidoreductase